MTGEELNQFLRSRRSIRRFKEDPISDALIERILETATYAPSAHNRQPWRFAVVTGPEARSRLAEAITGKFRRDMGAGGASEQEIAARVERTIRRTQEAPTVIVLCRDSAAVDPQADEAGRRAEVRMGEQSVALAGLQLLLAAHAEGLGGTWICWPLFAPQETRSALRIPDAWEPQGMVFLGYAGESPEPPTRQPLEEITLWI